MTGSADIDALAAEYVLGTLDAAERATAAARLLREPELQAAVADWERRLAPLEQLVDEVSPPPTLAAKVEARIAAAAAIPTSTGARPPTLDAGVVALDLQRRLRRWRTTALATSALAASLAVVLGLREVARPPAEQNFVAVFQKDDLSPSFVMSVDLATRTLSVRRVAAEAPAGKTYQLWIKADPLGPDPKSLGLVEGATTEVRQAIAGLDRGVVQGALFGVSLEPAGGSPKPTGPTFHARLIATSH